MCLRVIFYGKRKKDELAKLPDMVTCWKVVGRRGNQHSSKFIPDCFSGNKSLFLAGWNETETIYCAYAGYKIGFHAFRTKKTAEDWKDLDTNGHLVKCRTRKKDIVAIGEQEEGICLVTKRIWIPKPRKKSA